MPGTDLSFPLVDLVMEHVANVGALVKYPMPSRLPVNQWLLDMPHVPAAARTGIHSYVPVVLCQE